MEQGIEAGVHCARPGKGLYREVDEIRRGDAIAALNVKACP